MATRNDFYRAIRENKGKQVPVTLLRDKKEQTVTLNVGEGKNTKSHLDPSCPREMVEVERLTDDLEPVQMAELQPEIEEALANAQAAIGPEMDKVREQMKALEPQLQKEMQGVQEQMRKMEPQLREQVKDLQKIEPQIREQMKQFQNIEPQIREQIKDLQNIEPQIREQMKQFREMEPMIREQVLVQRTPLI